MVLKATAIPFRYVAARRRGRHLAVLALGPASGRPWFPLLRDGDLIPYSMTIALLASLRGSLHPSS